MLFIFIYAILATIVATVYQRIGKYQQKVARNSYNNDGPPKEVFSCLLGFFWPVTIPCWVTYAICNKVLDKLQKA